MTTAYAHDRSPGVLRVSGLEAGGYEVEWNLPSNQQSLLSPVFKGDCVGEGQRLECASGAVTVEFPRLDESGSEVWILREIGNEVTMSRVVNSQPVALETTEAIDSWFSEGVWHVLFGWDHLLFVVLLVLLMPNRRSLIVAVTGFTIGHTAVLLLSGDVVFPWSSAWVEAMIAFSIVFLAAELLNSRRHSLSRQYPFAISATFGLIHGFGFSGALRAWGIADSWFATLMFNLGVESGQLIVVAMTLLLFSTGGFLPDSQRTFLTRFTLYTIGVLTTCIGVIRLLGA